MRVGLAGSGLQSLNLVPQRGRLARFRLEEKGHVGAARQIGVRACERETGNHLIAEEPRHRIERQTELSFVTGPRAGIFRPFFEDLLDRRAVAIRLVDRQQQSF